MTRLVCGVETLMFLAIMVPAINNRAAQVRILGCFMVVISIAL
jgi:hypothetical protein